MRTGCSVLGTLEPEAESHPIEGARRIADRLMASFGSMLLYWHHFANGGKRIETKLPLGQPVPLRLTFPTAGTVTYACAMDMIRGTITVQ